jgi:site-specific DNA-cytosine methylase
VLCGNRRAAQRQLGNAVPPLLAQRIAEGLHEGRQMQKESQLALAA